MNCVWICKLFEMFYFYLKLCYLVSGELLSYPFLRLFNRMNYNGTEKLNGKVAIVTGSNTGIGKAAAQLLAQRGAKVIMACRDVNKANITAEEIKKEIPEADLLTMKLDLSSNKSIEQFADEVLREQPKINILVNNAGLFLDKYQLTEDGYETHWGVNYLSHFYLNLLLLDRLKSSENAKVVNVAALGHRLTYIHWDDINLEKDFKVVVAYSQAKLAQVMFTRELASRCPQVKTYSFHPGVVQTEIQRNVVTDNNSNSFFVRIFNTKLVKSSLEGAQTILYCLLDPKADKETGLYYQDMKVATNSDYVESSELRKQLWDLSLDMLKIPQDSHLRQY